MKPEQLRLEIERLEQTNQTLTQQLPHLNIKNAEGQIAELTKQKKLLEQGILRLKELTQ